MIDHLTFPHGGAAAAANEPPQFCWFIHDVIDPLGERFALFDDDGGRVEALRVRADLTSVSGFEAALHHGMRQLASVAPGAAARVRISNRESLDRAITILADVPEGVRVSDIIRAAATDEGNGDLAGDTATAIALGCAVLAAVATLEPVVHGAITAERLVLTAGRRVMILDGGMAPALRTIPNTRSSLWTELAIPMPPGVWSSPPFTPRSDAMQASLVMLELLLGRRLEPREFPGALGALAAEAADRAGSVILPTALREWLYRALSIDEAGGFSDGADALEALTKCRGCPRPGDRKTALAALATAWRLQGVEADVDVWQPSSETTETRHEELTEPRRAVLIESPSEPRMASRRDDMMERPIVAPSRPRPRAGIRSIDGALANVLWQKPLAVAAVAVILVLLALVFWRRSPATPAPTASAAPNPVAAVPPPAPQPPRAAAPVANASAPVAVPPPSPAKARAVVGVPARPVTERTVPTTGSVAQPAPAVEAVPARENTPVEVRTGVAHFNAVPWANVTVDGRPQGQTPLGNVTLAVGPHEIVFSHPELGTVRRAITVTADTPVRLSVTFGAEP